MFEVSREGERVRGLAEGIDRAHLRRLERGEVEVDRELDLHGLSRNEAREDVGYELRDAFASGERCVRIVHGRGRGSELGAVLQEALPGWLSEPPLARIVMAFCSALPHDGGTGALYVLLRRQR